MQKTEVTGLKQRNIKMKYEYKTIRINTLKGIKKAEKLHQSNNWKQVNVGWETITYERKNK